MISSIATGMLCILSLASVNTDTNLHTLSTYDIDPEEVTCSFYGGYFHGRQTANQEIYDQWAMTCASPRLPFNSLLLVVRGNRKAVIRVNDRGPYKTDSLGYAIFPLQPHPDRELDLSRAAFIHLFKDPDIGVGDVRIIWIIYPEEIPNDCVQRGSIRDVRRQHSRIERNRRLALNRRRSPIRL